MLDTKDIIILTAAFYLGNVVATFFKSLNDGILVPLLAPAAAAGKGITNFTIKVGSVELKIGQVINDLVSLIVSFALVVFTIGVLRSYILSRIGAGRGGSSSMY